MQRLRLAHHLSAACGCVQTLLQSLADRLLWLIEQAPKSQHVWLQPCPLLVVMLVERLAHELVSTAPVHNALFIAAMHVPNMQLWISLPSSKAACPVQLRTILTQLFRLACAFCWCHHGSWPSCTVLGYTCKARPLQQVVTRAAADSHGRLGCRLILCP